MKKNYTLKNKKRFYTIIFTLTFLLISSLSVINAYGYKEATYKEITIRNGDNLWNIAKKYGKDCDIREYIYEIKKINKLQSSELYAGTQIKVPMS